MALKKIWNLRADPNWINLVKAQADLSGRKNPGRYVRDLVFALHINAETREKVNHILQEVQYEQT